MMLDEEYRGDPELLAFYKVKLLVPGWAGEMTDAEAEYVGQEIAGSSVLRAAWRRALVKAGYKGKRRKRPSVYVVKMWNDALEGQPERA